jgi:hypothetical protein
MKTEVLPTLFSPTNIFNSFEGVNDSDLKHLKFSRVIELIHIREIIAGLWNVVNLWRVIPPRLE